MKEYYSIYEKFDVPYYYSYLEDGTITLAKWLTKKIKFNLEKKRNLIFDNELDAYLKGKLKKFTIKFLINKKKSFSEEVINELKNIPYGKVMTYKDIAVRLNNPNASRAVGNACRKNKFPLIIPCHRVVGKNNLGGYMGKKNKSLEIKIKESLLKHEGINL